MGHLENSVEIHRLTDFNPKSLKFISSVEGIGQHGSIIKCFINKYQFPLFFVNNCQFPPSLPLSQSGDGRLPARGLCQGYGGCQGGGGEQDGELGRIL